MEGYLNVKLKEDGTFDEPLKFTHKLVKQGFKILTPEA